MRNFLLSVLLLNVLAFAYQRWIIEPDQPRDALAIEQDYPRLQVLQPSPPPAEAPSAAAAAPPAAPPVAAVFRCLRIGPFASPDRAGEVRTVLAGQSVQVRQYAEQGQVWVGHWVQVVGQGNRAAAEAARDRLIGAGIRDAYIVSAEPPRISLGVFRARASADRIIETATRLGFETTMAERYQPGTNYWLSARLPGDRRLDSVDLRGDSGQILRTETVPCAELES